MSKFDLEADADVRRAWLFAKDAHEAVGQVRKYTGEPYIVHPVAVAGIVSTVEHTKTMLMAALLHDVVEDTNVTIEEIRQEFGAEVADMVDWLTDVSKPEDGNRAVRKEMDRQHTAMAPANVKTIKLADLIHNCVSILAHDMNFARTFLREKERLLEVLHDGDTALWLKAKALVIDGWRKIAEYDRKRFSHER